MRSCQSTAERPNQGVQGDLKKGLELRTKRDICEFVKMNQSNNDMNEYQIRFEGLKERGFKEEDWLVDTDEAEM